MIESQPPDPQPPDLSPDRSATALTTAKRYHQQGDLPAARAWYEHILATDPGNPEVLYLFGVICIEYKEYLKATELLSRAIRSWPDRPALMNTLGLALLGLGRWDAALERFRDAVRLQPDYVEAYCHAGRILVQQKKMGEAISELQKALARDPACVAANELLASALRALDHIILANYYQRIADHYAKKTDNAAQPPMHTFFVDRHRAWHTAMQNQRVAETTAITGMQMCYHLGDPFPEAPPNLIQVPVDRHALVAFFFATRFSFPVMVDFDPAVENEASLAMYSIKHLHEAWMARIQATEQLIAASYQTRPEFVPGQPWRIWLASSRRTTVMQYNTRDLAQGFRNHGCDVTFLLESDDRESLTSYHHIHSLHTFNPHIVVNINHLQNESLHPDIFNVIWWEDLMPPLVAGTPLSWRKRDLVYSINQELDVCLYRCGAPLVHRQGFCYDDTVFRDFGKNRQQKVVVIASSYRHALAEHPQAKQLVGLFTELFTAGEPMTDTLLEQFAKDSGMNAKDMLFFVWGYVVRDLSVRWLCARADMIEVAVYGRHWEEDDIVRPFCKGVLPHGPAVAEVYNTATYALVPHPFDLQSQRLMEMTACGCLPIVYDCRYRAEKPHWDEHCLWYRTQEELRACLTKKPIANPHAIHQGKSYTQFAERILTTVASQLADPVG